MENPREYKPKTNKHIMNKHKEKNITIIHLLNRAHMHKMASPLIME